MAGGPKEAFFLLNKNNFRMPSAKYFFKITTSSQNTSNFQYDFQDDFK
jgi:hypothetical protein